MTRPRMKNDPAFRRLADEARAAWVAEGSPGVFDEYFLRRLGITPFDDFDRVVEKLREAGIDPAAVDTAIERATKPDPEDSDA